MPNSHQPASTGLRGALGPTTAGGSLFALLFWWQSLTPSLIPRSWPAQAVIGATCLAIGYGIGTLAGRGMRLLLDRRGRWLGSAIRKRSGILLAAAWLVAVVLGARLWTGWQDEQRSFMGMASLAWWNGALASVLSAFGGVFLLVAGRSLAWGVAAGKRAIRRHVPPAVSVPATALLLLVLAAVGLPALTAAIQSGRGRTNDATTEGTVAPRSPSVSGSSASLVAWDTLGRMGRDFVASATSRRQLALFHGTDAGLVDPVRVYVGVRSAESAEQRARLAVRELERAGGFERKVLVVWVPTGTGWIVPKAAASLEQMHRGDTAIVAIQYSFLPSLLAIFMDAGRADEAGITLFAAVRARWLTLPPDRRPKLVLFGKSLGAEGVEAPFVGADAASSVADMAARTNGALIAGAKKSNPVHAQLTRERDRGSPFWQPVFDGGRTVRFLNRDPRGVAGGADWPAPRIVYLQHPADPAICWSTRALWRPPECMDAPRGFDMPQAARWFPIVSGVQAVSDVLNQLGVPPGFGHNYASEYVGAWASVTSPGGWTPADTGRLEQFVAEIAGDEAER